MNLEIDKYIMYVLFFIMGLFTDNLINRICNLQLIEGSDYESSDSQACCSDPYNPYGNACCTVNGEQMSGGDQHGIQLSVGCWCCNDSNCKGDNVCTQNNDYGCGQFGTCQKPDSIIDEFENIF